VIAQQVHNAQLVELDSIDHAPWLGDQDRIVDTIETFLTGSHRTPALRERTLATVLYTDIVASTARAAAMGDAKWHDIIREHDEIAKREVERGRGRLIKTMGDGVLATFDGPARAIRCAGAMRTALGTLGIAMRAGLHTGEVGFDDDDIGGIAVNIAARVIEHAGSGEVLTSATVRDLVIGSGLEFEDRGAHALKGVPGTWTLCSARL
jgi:class 3 adenylate cyclase